jgi:hypothetical protein
MFVDFWLLVGVVILAVGAGVMMGAGAVLRVGLALHKLAQADKKGDH